MKMVFRIIFSVALMISLAACSKTIPLKAVEYVDIERFMDNSGGGTRVSGLHLGLLPHILPAGPKADVEGCSSNWQSDGLQNRRLWVRIPPPLLD